MRSCASFLCALFVCLALVAPALAFPNPNGLKKGVERRGTSTLKQVTREQIVARSKVRPAKRQTSAAPFPICPDSPSTSGISFATFIDIAPSTGTNQLSAFQAGSYAECQESCGNTPGCGDLYFIENTCYLYSTLGGFYSTSGVVTSFAGTTCAAQVAAVPEVFAGALCCNSFV